MPSLHLTTAIDRRTYRVDRIDPSIVELASRYRRLAYIAEEVSAIAMTHDVDLGDVLSVEISLVTKDGARAVRPIGDEVLALLTEGEVV